MDDKRKCELYVVRVVPHRLREDSMTVGVVVVEPGGTFADFRLTRDWKRVECFAPDLELEIFDYLEATIREGLKAIGQRGDLAGLLERKFGDIFDVSRGKALLARDPAAEMRILERDYLAPMQSAERSRRMGRARIITAMENGFALAGVLDLLQRDLEMTEFTGENDPFKIDFGFRVGKSLKMFHALALSLSREPAVTLAYRYSRIRGGMQQRGEEALLTAVISEEARRAKGEIGSGVAMLEANGIRVRPMGEIEAIAEEVRREIAS